MTCCPSCNATHDYHPDPGGPNGETWWVCENCGYTKDHLGKVIEEGSTSRRLNDQDEDND